MDPEQRLLVVMKYLAVEILVVLILALARHTCPERVRVIDRLRLFLLRHSRGFLTLLSRFLHCLLVVFNPSLLSLFFALLRGIALILEEDRGGHEGAVFLEDLTDAVLIAELQAVIIEEEGDLRTGLSAIPFSDTVSRLPVALPVYRFCIRQIGKSIDVHLISDHKSRIKTEAEMADDLSGILLILIFFQECRCA